MLEFDIAEEQLNGDIIALFLSTVSSNDDFYYRSSCIMNKNRWRWNEEVRGRRKE